MKSETIATGAGGVGAALGILVVTFMPASIFVFTPETAAVATGALGVVFTWAMRFAPKPGA